MNNKNIHITKNYNDFKFVNGNRAINYTHVNNLVDSIKEIKDAFTKKQIENFNDPKHNNYKFLYSSKEIQKEVFIEGISGSLDVP